MNRRQKAIGIRLALACALVAFLLMSAGTALPMRTLLPNPSACVACAEADRAFYLTGSDIVYVTRTGHCYHTTDHCGSTKEAYDLSITEAIRLGYAPCGSCKPDNPSSTDMDFSLPEDEPAVWFMLQDLYYHRSGDCPSIRANEYGAVPAQVTLSEALHLHKSPCPDCSPPE